MTTKPLETEIAVATIADINVISALSMEVWLDTYALDGVTKEFAAHVLDEYSPQSISEQLAKEQNRFLVCRNSKGVQGYVKLNLNAEPLSPSCGRVELETLYVRRHHHRLGLGKSLFEAAIQIAGPAARAAIFLTVYQGNSNAIAFYKSQGMRIAGEWTFEFEGGSVPNLIMTFKP
jgi:diamine N-acetyltransferase